MVEFHTFSEKLCVVILTEEEFVISTGDFRVDDDIAEEVMRRIFNSHPGSCISRCTAQRLFPRNVPAYKDEFEKVAKSYFKTFDTTIYIQAGPTSQTGTVYFHQKDTGISMTFNKDVSKEMVIDWMLLSAMPVLYPYDVDVLKITEDKLKALRLISDMIVVNLKRPSFEEMEKHRVLGPWPDIDGVYLNYADSPISELVYDSRFSEKLPFIDVRCTGDLVGFFFFNFGEKFPVHKVARTVPEVVKILKEVSSLS